MENKSYAIQEMIGGYEVYYEDNRLFVGKEDDKTGDLKGTAFQYKNNSIRFINYESKIIKDNKTYNYGIILDNNGLKIGMFSFDDLGIIVDSIYVNYNNDISILNGDNKVIIDKDNVNFFSKEKEIKKIKHNIRIEHPKFLKDFNDLKIIYPKEEETKKIDNVTYTKIMESDTCSVYFNSKVTDRNSKFFPGKDVTIRILLISGDKKMLFTLSNFEKNQIVCGDFTYIIGEKQITFFEDDLCGLVLEFGYNSHLDANFIFDGGKMNIVDSACMTIVSDLKGHTYGYDEIYGNKNNHIVNLADVTSNIKLDNNSLIDAEEELNKLVGLEAAKKQIRRFKNTCIKAMENGSPINLHMMFLGNPGTGKTTFARLVADIFYKNGILPTNKYVEGSRDTLVGQYVGETEEKTNAIFQKAMGGVLFIDEAYSLYRPDTPNDFGNVAMAELIKLMEDYRGKICVIFAGYTKEMHDLLRINSGLKSRIQSEIQFDDYSKSDLRQILDINVKKDNYEINDEDSNLIIDFVDKKRINPDFANAREVRTALEQITMIQAERTFKTDINDRRILNCDVLKYISENTTKSKAIEAPTYKMINKDYLMKCSEIVLDLDKDYEKIIESCIEITINDYSGRNQSSAFIISPDGYAITAGHSVKDAISISARRRILDRLHNTVETYHKCYVCGVDAISDIAIIKIENELDNKFPYLPLYTGKEYLPIFTEIVVFGYPLGTHTYDNLSGFKGYISSMQVVNNRNAYNLDVIAMPGSSGACLIDVKTMKVIGIVNGLKSSNGHGIPFGCPIQEIWKLVDGGDDNE